MIDAGSDVKHMTTSRLFQPRWEPELVMKAHDFRLRQRLLAPAWSSKQVLHATWVEGRAISSYTDWSAYLQSDTEAGFF